MSNYAELFNPSQTSQSEPMNERQKINHAGGFVFTLDKWARLNRFLILGSDSATYYQSAKELTKENAKCVLECLSDDPERTIKTVVDVSVAGHSSSVRPPLEHDCGSAERECRDDDCPEANHRALDFKPRSDSHVN